MTSKLGPEETVIDEKEGQGTPDGGDRITTNTAVGNHRACFQEQESTLTRECINKQERLAVVTVQRISKVALFFI